MADPMLVQTPPVLEILAGSSFTIGSSIVRDPASSLWAAASSFEELVDRCKIASIQNQPRHPNSHDKEAVCHDD